MSERLILLSNDDGAWSPGLASLARVAAGFGRVVIVAPDRNRSAISSALSLHDILRVQELGPDRYACTGTPVDCVLLGIRALLEQTPDWVQLRRNFDESDLARAQVFRPMQRLTETRAAGRRIPLDNNQLGGNLVASGLANPAIYESLHAAQ